VRAVLVVALMVLTGGILWQILQLESTSPTATIPTASRLPTSTPDARIEGLIEWTEAWGTPTPTNTPRPVRTLAPTKTPLVYCPTITTEGIPCSPQSPTPTKTPRPVMSPTLGPEPCSTALARAGDGEPPFMCYSD
jgi:hypothetical protein